MAIATSLSDSFDYVLEADRHLPPEQQTVFVLQPLTFQQRCRLEDLSLAFDANSGTGYTRSGTAKELALRAGLKGWRNFKDADGNEVDFETEGRRLDVLGRLVDPPKYSTLEKLRDCEVELTNAITAGNRLRGTDAKN